VNTLRLSSSNSDIVVEFSDIEDDYFRVAVRSHDHSATRRVYAYTDGAGIARLFTEAAEQWKGWQDAKVWESLEGEFRIELRIDCLGHVSVAIRVRSDPGGADPWQLEAELGLGAGQMEGVAKVARQLWTGRG
jgi:hypothetical protein